MSIALLVLTAIAATPIAPYHCVGFDNGYGASLPQPTVDGFAVKGVSLRSALVGDAVDLVSIGTATCTAAQAITAGQLLIAAADGTVVPAGAATVRLDGGAVGDTPLITPFGPPATGSQYSLTVMGADMQSAIVGRALTSAAGAGELVDVLLSLS
jgi:hypothetical protein